MILTRLTLSLAVLATLTGCGAANRSPGAMAQTTTITAIRPADPSDPSGFGRWVQDFRAQALASGVSASTYDRAMASARYNSEVVRLDSRQSEFTKPIWDYLDGAVSESRVAQGRQMLARHAGTLSAIESRYGVDKEAVVAIWGMESNFGANRGNTQIISALATLTYDGRRADFFAGQLIDALRIVQAGDVDAQHMVGSWAGAMGHTQFMPGSFLTYAVDFNGDGRRDIWSDDPTDALASTAAYLQRSGWQRGQGWGAEVILPQGFDYAQAGKTIRKSSGAWASMGVRGASGSLPGGTGYILVPAGARGPAFFVTDSYDAILKYNTSTSYALGVALLSDRLKGKPGVQQTWPRGDRPLSSAEKSEMQRLLTAKGFDTGKIDGKIGTDSIEAIKRYQRSRGLVPDGYADTRLLADLRN